MKNAKGASIVSGRNKNKDFVRSFFKSDSYGFLLLALIILFFVREFFGGPCYGFYFLLQ